MKEPKVTIYITNYNYAKYIEQAVESILNQTFKDFELLIIDDGSTDNSREIISQYSDVPQVKIIYQQNKGLNITNNIALRLAKGDYIMRLDADDYLESSAVQKMVDQLEINKKLGLVFPDYYIVDSDGNILERHKRFDFEEEVKLMDRPAHGACTMIRVDYLREIGGYNEKYRCQDGYDLWVKFIQTYPVKNINEPLFNYRRHGENLTSNEQRILNTRSLIHQEHIEKKYKELPTLAIIPIRGMKSNHQLAFQKIGDKNLIDIKISEAKASNHIKKIIVSSPDQKVQTYIEHEYSNDSQVLFNKRPIEMAQYNVGLSETIEHIIHDKSIFDYENFVSILILGLEYPFISSRIITDAINAMFLFQADSLISVREEMNSFYRPTGNGMVPILDQDKFTKLEREAIYKHVGGISVITVDEFINTKKMISGKVGHIVVDQISSHGIFSNIDLKIAQFINPEIEKPQL